MSVACPSRHLQANSAAFYGQVQGVSDHLDYKLLLSHDEVPCLNTSIRNHVTSVQNGNAYCILRSTITMDLKVLT
jgi:hypothetical protein